MADWDKNRTFFKVRLDGLDRFEATFKWPDPAATGNGCEVKMDRQTWEQMGRPGAIDAMLRCSDPEWEEDRHG